MPNIFNKEFQALLSAKGGHISVSVLKENTGPELVWNLEHERNSGDMSISDVFSTLKHYIFNECLADELKWKAWINQAIWGYRSQKALKLYPVHYTDKAGKQRKHTLSSYCKMEGIVVVI